MEGELLERLEISAIPQGQTLPMLVVLKAHLGGRMLHLFLFKSWIDKGVLGFWGSYYIF